MADTKISALTDGTTAQSTDRLPIARSGANYYITPGYIKTLLIGAGSVSIASGKTLTANNTLTLAGTDSTTMTFPSSSTTLAGLSIANSFTTSQNITPSSDVISLALRRNGAAQTSNILEIQTEANAFLAGFDKAGLLTLGAATRQTGILKLAGTTSGVVSLSVADAAGTWSLTLPTTAGTNGYVLSTDGAGVTSWVAQSGGSSTLTVGSTATSGGAAGQIMFDTGSVLSESSALTFANNTLQINGVKLLGATATLQLGDAAADTKAAVVPQFLQVQGVSAGGTADQGGQDFTIRGSQSKGNQAGGKILFQISPAGSSGSSLNAFVTAMTINADKSVTFANGAAFGYNFVTFSGNITFDGGQGYISTFADFTAGSTGSFGFSSSQYPTGPGSNDVYLRRDAADTLALRRGTNAQKFRVYNTYTSSTNYENFEIDWKTTANVALVGPTKGSGGGTQRVQRLQYLEDGGTGSTTPSLGTTCPAASATIKSWIKVVTSDGTTGYIPCWA